MAASLAIRLSGGSSNANPLASLGGAMSSEAAVGSTLFDIVDAAEAAAGDTEYRCVYLYNDGDKDLDVVKFWFESQPTRGAIAAALGGEGVNGTAEVVGSEGTAPTGESFSAPSSLGAAINVGPLAVGERYPLWLRRVITAASAGIAAGSNTFVPRVDFEYVP